MRTYNIKYAYFDEDDPYLGILAVEEYVIRSTANSLKVYSPVKVFLLTHAERRNI